MTWDVEFIDKIDARWADLSKRKGCSMTNNFRELRDYVKALGGELKLVASFPDAEIQVHPFEVAR